MTFYLNILFVTLIFVIGIDILGFWDEFSKLLSRIITKGKVVKPIDIKPFSCSVCCVFWSNIIYMFVSHNFSIFNVFIIIALAMLAPEMGSLIIMFKDWIAALINKLTPKK